MLMIPIVAKAFLNMYKFSADMVIIDTNELTQHHFIRNINTLNMA